MSQKFLDDKQQNHHKSQEEDDSSPPPTTTAPIANWKISSPGDDPDDVKARLKYWAQTVACTVRLCSWTRIDFHLWTRERPSLQEWSLCHCSLRIDLQMCLWINWFGFYFKILCMLCVVVILSLYDFNCVKWIKKLQILCLQFSWLLWLSAMWLLNIWHLN